MRTTREGCCVYTEKDRERVYISGNTQGETERQQVCLRTYFGILCVQRERNVVYTQRETKRNKERECVCKGVNV